MLDPASTIFTFTFLVHVQSHISSLANISLLPSPQPSGASIPFESHMKMSPFGTVLPTFRGPNHIRFSWTS